MNEVYDNITQVLVLVRIKLSLLDEPEHGYNDELFTARQLTSIAIHDLLNLGKLLKPETDIILSLGLEVAIEKKLKRFFPKSLFVIYPEDAGPK